MTGQIINAETGVPIHGAQVVALCWYMTGIDDADFKKQTSRTDQNGNYQFSFDKGHQVDIAARANGFYPNRWYSKLADNSLKVDIKLDYAKENPTLRAFLDSGGQDKGLRVRFYGDSADGLKSDSVQTLGFDFSSFQITSDTTNCDIWFAPLSEKGHTSVIVSNSKGGIIPVKEVNNFLFDLPTAPETGYTGRHRLIGNEQGFFVLCRDGKTYGKIVFLSMSVESNFSDGNGGRYIEYGKPFHALYQPTGSRDLSYYVPDLDLERYLVSIEYR